MYTLIAALINWMNRFDAREQSRRDAYLADDLMNKYGYL